MATAKTMYLARSIPLVLLFILALFLAPAGGRVAEATNGDLVGQVQFSQDCASGIGVGIAYDGTNLWYTCYGGSPDLLRADPRSGAVSATYTIAGGLGAIAYDAKRNALWAGPGGANAGSIWLIQLDGGKNAKSWAVQFDAGADAEDLVDGIAYDASDDSLYFKPDNSLPIHHYTTAGTRLADRPGPDDPTACGSGVSGLALGGNLVYEGRDGCSHVSVVDKATNTFKFGFSTIVSSDPNFRDEGLTCDPNTFATSGKQVMWSKEAYSPMRAHAYEVPAGSCGSGGQAVVFDDPQHYSDASLTTPLNLFKGCASVAAIGCALTSFSDVTRSYGLQTFPDGNAVNPDTMNAFLSKVQSGCYMLWAAAAKAVDKAATQQLGHPILGSPTVQFPPNAKYYPKTRSTDWATRLQTINSALDQGNLVIIGMVGVTDVKGHFTDMHFIVLYQKVVNPDGTFDYYIVDPAYRDGSHHGALLSATYGKMQDIGPSNVSVVTFNSGAHPGRVFTIQKRSPVDLLITDPNGRRTGIDPATGSNVQDVPDSMYAVEPAPSDDIDGGLAGPEHGFFVTTAPVDGTYEIEVTGTGTGPYHLDFSMVTDDGDPSLQTFDGNATPGSHAVYEVQVAGGAVVVKPPPPAAAPLAVDQIVSANQTSPSQTFSTPSLSTTAPDELAVAFISSDGPATPTQAVSSVTGGGLAWSLVGRANGSLGTAEVWEAHAANRLDSAVITASLAASGYDGSITVATFIGASPVIGASAIGAAPTGAPNVTLTTTRAGSLLWAVGHDWHHMSGRTPMQGQKLVSQFLDSRVRDTSWTQATTQPVASAGTAVAVGDTAPTTDQWDLAAVEITSAASGVEAFGPDTIRSADQTTPASSFSSPPVWTSTNNELLLALISTDGPKQQAQAVTAVSGAGLAWTRAAHAGGSFGASEVWQAYATGPVTGAAVTATLADGGYEGAITVVGFTGANPALGAASAQAGSSGPPGTALTTTVAGSMVWAVGHDWSRATAVTPPSGQVLVNQFLDTVVHDSSWVQRTAPIGKAGTVVNVTDAGPTTDRWNLAAVEVLPAPSNSAQSISA